MSLKKFFRNLIVSGAMISTLLPSINTKAENLEQRIEERMPERELMFDFANPVDNLEANSKAWYSATQLAGKVNDVLGLKLGLDDKLAGRVGLFLFSFDQNRSLWNLSHEFGHVREGSRYGEYDFEFDTDTFDYQGILSHGFEYAPTEDQFLREEIAGLNQEEFNSFLIFKNKKENLPFDNAISFLISKLGDVRYITLCSSKHHRDRGSDNEEFNIHGDVNSYIYFLNKKGIDLSKGSYLSQALIADALSVYTWDSIAAIVNYLVNGKRDFELTKFKIGETEITPPLINHYLTPEGGFYNITFFLDKDLEIEIGTDADFIGDGDVDCLRFGGKYHNLKPFESLELSPFVYLNLDKSFGYGGVSAGIEIYFPIAEGVGLTGKIEYSKDDILENTVKGEDEGFNFSVGMDIDF